MAQIGKGGDIMRSKKSWSNEEVEFIKNYYNDHNAIELAEALDRSEEGVRYKIYTLKLTKQVELKALDENNKICTKCKKEQPKTEFSKNIRTKDGLKCWCKTCCSHSNALYKADKKNEKKKQELEEIKKQTASIMKRCTKCGELKAGGEFTFIYSRKRRESECSECAVKRKRNALLNDIKEGKQW